MASYVGAVTVFLALMFGVAILILYITLYCREDPEIENRINLVQGMTIGLWIVLIVALVGSIVGAIVITMVAIILSFGPLVFWAGFLTYLNA